MSDVETSIEVAAAPADVWAVLTDFDLLGEWIAVHAGFAEPPPPLRVGAEFVQKLCSGDLAGEVEWTVEEVSEPELLAWTGAGPAGAVARVRYLLSPCETGTLIEYHTDFDMPGGPLSGVATKAIQPRGQEEAEKSLARLRDLVEGRAEAA
jgi:carbon monoxide dehydrogenase subunit G